MKHTGIFILLLILPSLLSSQETDSLSLGFREYLNMVKTYHPVVKQAGIMVDRAEAEVRKSRGNFDPKIEVDYDRKDFKQTEYYDILTSSFKIPTWYGIELKAKFENNSGEFLNPQNKTPEDGLFSAGIAIPVAQGLLINERMASLKQARIFREQSELERQIAVNSILYEASLAYFDWLKTYRHLLLYRNFAKNAETRFKGIVKSYELGDKPAIDTLEASLTVQDRKLNLEQARLDYMKASLHLSNFLWGQENTPLELKENMFPDRELPVKLDEILEINELSDLDDHPKLRSLNYKIRAFEFDKKLKANKLLPKLDLEYNFLSSEIEGINSLNYDDYKFGMNFSIPLFLRKERGELQLAKLKLENAGFDLISQRVTLQNKILSLRTEVGSLSEQSKIMNNLIDSYEKMLRAEERKLELGESSVFLVNSRESSLIAARQKNILLQNKLLYSKAELFRIMARIPEI
ncbi:TolC family protein [Christiangramia crocea]|uniref:TolC family protein n=1 Tax=Christiangramia crocea TaxID=2904124 RepID=A0A9X2A6W0_9FLAO|nr:TolC family protein [Gramella crocea]MCG9970293.1 TolC family protein [Gramella crocea]